MFKGRHLPFLLSEKDERIKLMNERINITEKHLEELCSIFGAYTRKLARYRDKNDDLAKAFDQYSDEEDINKSLSSGTKSFAKALTIMADYIDLEVHRLEFKIVNELAQYENICKNVRENLKTAVTLRDKEVHRQKQLIDIKSKFSANSSAADSELLKAKLEVNRTNKQIDEIIENFEKQKLHDVKSIILNFIMIQIKQYSKAIEILSATYYDVSNINEKQDFQEFRKVLKMKEKSKKIYFKNEYRSQSMESLAIANISSPIRQRRDNLSKSSKDLSGIVTEDENDDQEDSDEQSGGGEEETSLNDDTGSESEIDFQRKNENPLVSQRTNVFKTKKVREGIPIESLP